MMKNANKAIFAALLILTIWTVGAQQPQTSTAPIYAANAKYTNGVAPGYWPTKGSGLTLNLSAGTSFCNASVVTYAGGTLTMSASTTNNVYLNTASSCVPATKTTAFVAGDIPIAQVVAGSSTITSIADVRTPFIANTAATTTIASGTSSLGTSAISSASCATVITTTATGTASTDGIIWNANGSIKAVTGYVPSVNGGLSIAVYPTTNNVNFDVCNWTSASVTPGAITINWRVVR